MSYGRIDVHSHLLPGIDDGSKTIAESIRCARALVEAGYTHSFVTPHIWPSLPDNTVETIPARAKVLQSALDEAQVPLKLLAGGENTLHAGLQTTDPQHVVTYGMARRFVLIDFWISEITPIFEPTIRWLQSLGLKVVIAHPERTPAVHLNPGLMDYFAQLGALLQGNLQCLSDDPASPNRCLVERFLQEDRYTFLGSDLHNWETLGLRLKGLERAIELVGQEKVDQLTRINPQMLL
ncbi:MAG: hypothetical protein IT448_03660 [Phycisphaerales bacterium]|nr:hypothetical protein [Phycisphaerales bacterium]